MKRTFTTVRLASSLMGSPALTSVSDGFQVMANPGVSTPINYQSGGTTYTSMNTLKGYISGRVSFC
ncbi:MAG TPA: hypothetical protein P5275_14905 [Saprospiraceae bacterium]|nr:hypothetical protein [Saprospiraceae bacterium]MCB9268876.1 hypothetical protein [Lewinellaceae bacterium]HPG08257.1 hypothetical protein [Saprospiraceae bacterium]HRV86161.1 hypothetical protein [Saprospiraceae bacterium]